MDFEKRFSDFDTNNYVYKKLYKKRVADEEGLCDRCPWHGGENAGRSRKQKDDKYKTLDRRRSRTVKNRERRTSISSSD